MKAQGTTVKEILLNLPEDRTIPFNRLHDVTFPKALNPPLVMVD